MTEVFLVRGYAANDVILWLAVIALIVVMLGGRWLIHKLSAFMQRKFPKLFSHH